MSLIKKDSSSVRNILQVVCRRKEKIMAYSDRVLLAVTVTLLCVTSAASTEINEWTSGIAKQGQV